MNDREELEILECQINHLTSENIELEQKYKEGIEANLILVKNREKLKDLMQRFIGVEDELS